MRRWIVPSVIAVVVFLGEFAFDGVAGSSTRSRASTRDEQFTAVVASAMTKSSSLVRGTDGKYHAVYELELQNTRSVPATLAKIEVVSGKNTSRVLASYEGAQLLENLGTLAARPVDDTVIEPNAGRLFAVEVVFDSPGAAPSGVLHRIEALAAANPGARQPSEVSVVEAPHGLNGARPVVIGPPAKGSRWVAVNGCCRVGFPHRFTAQTVSREIGSGEQVDVGGHISFPERFAIDWMRLDQDGLLFSGDPSVSRNWADYGAQELAVADGTVVDVRNDLDDQPTGQLPDPSSFKSLEDVQGNHVIIRFDNGSYGFYAHVQKGSVRVKKGDKVKRGDVVARLGNSGNTSGPHLHFQLQTTASPFVSDSVPYVIDKFDYAGQVDRDAMLASETLGEQFGQGRIDKPQPRKGEYPLQLNIVDFPG